MRCQHFYKAASVAVLFFGCVLAVILFTLPSRAQSVDELRHKLEHSPRPWNERVHRITQTEYEETLRFWADKHREWVSLEQVGQSVKGRGIHLLAATDRSVPDDDKHVCLVTALHGGPERSGTSTILHLVEWLLGGDPEAAEVRRKQIVLIMPIVNPEAYFETDRFGNVHGIDPYTGGGPENWDFTTLTYKRLNEAPEVAAFLSVVDRYQPEAIVDVHGIGLQEFAVEQLGDRTMYQGQTMFEVTGSAYSNYALRPWDWRVTEAMVDSGVQAGYPSDRFEADAQRLFWGPALQPIADRFWLGRPNFYTAQYAYAKYHSLLAALEVGWEESGLRRLQGLLHLGNEGTPGQRGYPVNHIRSFCGHFISAYGVTAAERRRSRVELWESQSRFTQAMLYPQTDGRDTYLVALTPEAGALIQGDKMALLDALRSRPEMDAEAIRVFFEAGPEVKLAAEPAARPPEHPVATAPPRHGFCLKLRLPYRDPQIIDLRLNGRVVAEDAAGACRRYFADGFTQIEVSMPGDRLAATDLLIVTCAYVPDTKRSHGWTPPVEVRQQLERSSSRPQ